jgi:hypothetical protein
MKLLFLIATILLLFVSGWGNVLAAAFCPHEGRQTRACPSKEATHHDHGMNSSHEAMTMGEMEGMGIQTSAMPNDAAPATGSQARVADQPMDDCAHCVSHSRFPTVPSVTGVVDQSKRGEDMAAPPAPSITIPLAAAHTTPIYSRQHGPPGATISRQVLINIFRI